MGANRWTSGCVLFLICVLFDRSVVPVDCALDTAEITRVLEISLACHPNPAMSVAVVKDGQIIYSKGFGVRDLSTRDEITDETVFGFASVTKSFAAALLVKQLYENNMTLDSKVKDLLGDEFVMPDTVRTEETTFEDLLAHKTAMLENNRIRIDQNFSRDTVMSRLRHQRTNKQFRVDFVYNNLMYGLASKISEIIDGSGKKWEELISDNIFKPLGMSKSTFATRIDFNRKDLALAYADHDGPKIYERVTPELTRRFADSAPGSGAIMSTAKDMVKWLNFHINKGKNEQGRQVMDKKLVEMLQTPRFLASNRKYIHITRPQFPVTVRENYYGLALRIGNYRGYELVTHTGSTYGYTSYIGMLPTEKIGVVIMMTNRDAYYKHRSAVAFYLLDSALGLKPWINESTICTFPEPWINKSKKRTFRPKKTDIPLKLPLQEYQGVFTSKAFGNFVIGYNSTLKSLVGHYGWGSWEMLLWPSSSTQERFFGKAIGPVVPPDMKPFHVITHPDSNDVVVGLKAGAFDSMMPPIFCKQEHQEVCLQIEAKTYPTKEDICSEPSGQNSSAVLSSHKECIFVFLILLCSWFLF